MSKTKKRNIPRRKKSNNINEAVRFFRESNRQLKKPH